jgi:hypothetical protein
MLNLDYPTLGFIAYTNIQSITNQSINPALINLIDWLFRSLWIDCWIWHAINQSINPPNPDCLIASLLGPTATVTGNTQWMYYDRADDSHMYQV